MSDQKPITYKFSTFQELFDRVPADRILDCMTEIGHAMTVTKHIVEAIRITAESLAAADGKSLNAGLTAKMPETWEWVDDGQKKIDLKYQMESQETFGVGLKLR